MSINIGHRGYFLKDMGVMLNQAFLNYGKKMMMIMILMMMMMMMMMIVELITSFYI